MRYRFSLGFVGVLALLGCGSDKTLTAKFSASRQPALIAIVSMTTSGATSVDLTLTDANKQPLATQLDDNPNALLGCAKYLGWIRSDVSSGGVSGKEACSGANVSSGLAGFFASIIQPGIGLPADAYSTSAFTLKNNSSGFVFFLSFYDLQADAGLRCFQMTASEIVDGKFFVLGTGSQADSLEFSVSDTPYPGTGDNPTSDRTKCFRF